MKSFYVWKRRTLINVQTRRCAWSSDSHTKTERRHPLKRELHGSYFWLVVNEDDLGSWCPEFGHVPTQDWWSGLRVTLMQCSVEKCGLSSHGSFVHGDEIISRTWTRTRSHLSTGTLSSASSTSDFASQSKKRWISLCTVQTSFLNYTKVFSWWSYGVRHGGDREDKPCALIFRCSRDANTVSSSPAQQNTCVVPNSVFESSLVKSSPFTCSSNDNPTTMLLVASVWWWKSI